MVLTEPGEALADQIARLNTRGVTHISALDTTETFKQKRQQLAREGFDPLLVTDPLFFREPVSGAYRELAAANYARILDGSIRL